MNLSPAVLVAAYMLDVLLGIGGFVVDLCLWLLLPPWRRARQTRLLK